MIGPELRGPAPRANAGNRREVTRNENSPTILNAEPEADFAALFVARRYRLAAPLARVVVELARIGEASA